MRYSFSSRAYTLDISEDRCDIRMNLDRCTETKAANLAPAPGTDPNAPRLSIINPKSIRKVVCVF